MSQESHFNPEVSVLISCYNANQWLHEAIDSVLGQTFKSFELILIDDGSTDNTSDIIKEYCKRDARIIPLFKSNTGLADSLNVGIAIARGTWIARLDADDLCEPSRLEEQLNYVHNHPDVVLLGTDYIEIDECGLIVNKHRFPSDHFRLKRHLERMQRFFPHSSAFYRKDAARQCGGYHGCIRRAEDWDLWLRLASKGRIGCLPGLLVRIRKHQSQISLEENGLCQLNDAIAATTCHFLRTTHYTDPANGTYSSEWNNFRNWIEKRTEELHIFDRHSAWMNARATFFSSDKRFYRYFCFAARILQSGHAIELLKEKLFGSSFPNQLALEWKKRPSDCFPSEFNLDLRRIQNVQLKILKECIRIFEKHNIRYYLVCGSALGAVRHAGFIPWDDDIDIGVPRSDYDKLLDIVQTELPAELFLQTHETDPCYPLFYAKIRNSNTTFIESCFSHLNINHGVYIDIFPLDGISTNFISRWLIILLFRTLRAAILHQAGIKKRHLFLHPLILALAKLAPMETMRKMIESLAKMNDYESSHHVINWNGIWRVKRTRHTILNNIWYQIQLLWAGSPLEIIPKDCYGVGCKMIFEDILAVVPSNYDGYLKTLYQDYMTPPPAANRAGNHLFDRIDLDNPYDKLQFHHQMDSSGPTSANL